MQIQFHIGKTVHIVHAPNHMAVKGSAFIEDAIRRLTEEDASPTTIYDVLKNLLDHPETWKEIGEKSRAYVEKHHSIEVIGKYFDKINRNTGITPKRERMVQLE